MKNSLRQEILLLVSVASFVLFCFVFLLHHLKDKMLPCKDERLQDLLGWIFLENSVQ